MTEKSLLEVVCFLLSSKDVGNGSNQLNKGRAEWSLNMKGSFVSGLSPLETPSDPWSLLIYQEGTMYSPSNLDCVILRLPK